MDQGIRSVASGGMLERLIEDYPELEDELRSLVPDHRWDWKDSKYQRKVGFMR